VRIEGAGALIAGGASGLGAATARRLHAEGARVVIADVDFERGEALAAELGGARFLRTDVGEPGELEAAVAAAGEGALRLDTPLLATVSDDFRAALAAGVARPRRLGSPDESAALVVHRVENPTLNRESIRLDGAPRRPGGVAA
jgi:NADPH:quinone reductase-like Zn-dependent oxidoreductase